jgi:hypothetical protein
MPPYVPNLFVAEGKDVDEDEDYIILLNKFCVVPGHILLVTKGWFLPSLDHSCFASAHMVPRQIIGRRLSLRLPRIYLRRTPSSKSSCAHPTADQLAFTTVVLNQAPGLYCSPI